jgi:hypothetical protein
MGGRALDTSPLKLPLVVAKSRALHPRENGSGGWVDGRVPPSKLSYLGCVSGAQVSTRYPTKKSGVGWVGVMSEKSRKLPSLCPFSGHFPTGLTPAIANHGLAVMYLGRQWQVIVPS